MSVTFYPARTLHTFHGNYCTETTLGHGALFQYSECLHTDCLQPSWPHASLFLINTVSPASCEPVTAGTESPDLSAFYETQPC
jgi:hypothetical protein